MDELAERRARRDMIEPPQHPMCRCVAMPLDPPARRSLWQRFKDWRARRRAKRQVDKFLRDAGVRR